MRSVTCKPSNWSAYSSIDILDVWDMTVLCSLFICFFLSCYLDNTCWPQFTLLDCLYAVSSPSIQCVRLKIKFANWSVMLVCSGFYLFLSIHLVTCWTFSFCDWLLSQIYNYFRCTPLAPNMHMLRRGSLLLLMVLLWEILMARK